MLLSTSAIISSATSAIAWPTSVSFSAWQSCALLSASSSARLIGAQRPAGHERHGFERVERRLERRRAEENELQRLVSLCAAEHKRQRQARGTQT